MAASRSFPFCARFDQFHVDLQSGVLQRSGTRVPIQGQPLQVLSLLLEANGKVVTRDELRQVLWREDTFVDFELGVNTAVKKLRQALEDSAEHPKFIETLPKVGYRFLIQVEWVTDGEKGSQATSNDRALRVIGKAATSGISASRHPLVLPSGKNLLKRVGFLAALALLVLIGLAFWRIQPQPPSVANVVRITNDGKAKDGTVSDGVHLYFTEGLPHTSGSGLAQVSVAGGETTWMTTTLKDVWVVNPVSPDRSELLVAKAVGANYSSELWVQPLPGGAPHRVGNILSILATWTPDGTHIVYDDDNAIMIANKDGSDPHLLAKVPGIVFQLRFSPDGRRIRFDLFEPKKGIKSIWEMGANGEGIHPLLPDWKESSTYCCGNWSPDGNYYYFQAGHGSAQTIWVMPEIRSIFRGHAKRPVRLMSGPLSFSSPLPSSDSKRLFVVGEEPRVELLRYDLQARRFDPFLPALSAGPVDFSLDRKWMAYVSYPDMTLWRSRVDGSNKMQLTFPPVRAYEPRWSPDGSQIVFLDVQFERPWKICMLSPSGGSPETLLLSNNNQADPTWAPDGKSIVFGQNAKNDEDVAIYHLELKTREVSSVPDSVGLYSPRVSPDGRYISALTNGATKLMLFDTKTSNWSTLVEGEAVGYNEWSPDGAYVYFRENHGGAAELARVRIKDRQLDHVLSLKDFPQRADKFASWIGLTPDGAPLLMRDRSIQEIYALELQFH